MEDQENLKSFESDATYKNAFKEYKPASDGEQIPQKLFVTDLYINLEIQTLRLKEALENWREIIFFVYSVILWEKNWYPAAIVGGTSFVFLSIWLLEPSVLTTISILGLTLTVSDYLVPYVAAMVFKSDSWTGVKEKAFYESCREIVLCKTKIQAAIATFYSMRMTRPKMYYGCTIFVLAILAWIGNSFNNLFLTYILLTVLLLLPGTERHGILKKYGSTLKHRVSEYTKIKVVSKEQ